MSCTSIHLFIFHMIMTAIAIVLSFRCNNKSFDLVSFIFALFFPYIYIIYILGTRNLSQSCDI
jgi:threonine/homoserine efflux transporter RhtA